MRTAFRILGLLAQLLWLEARVGRKLQKESPPAGGKLQ